MAFGLILPNAAEGVVRVDCRTLAEESHQSWSKGLCRLLGREDKDLGRRVKTLCGLPWTEDATPEPGARCWWPLLFAPASLD